MQKNKATESHLGLLIAKLSMLRGELMETSSGKKGVKEDLNLVSLEILGLA